AFLDCEENEDTGELRNCKGHIEICGPMSGTYQIVLSSAHGSKYSISVSASSQRKRDGAGYEMTGSRADLKGDIRGQEAAVGAPILKGSGDSDHVDRKRAAPGRPKP